MGALGRPGVFADSAQGCRSVPGSGRRLPGMRRDPRTKIHTFRSSTPITVGRILAFGDWPWHVIKVKLLNDGRYRVTLRR